MKVYVARDDDNEVYLYYNKPIKRADIWESVDAYFNAIPEEALPSGVNPQWIDKKPIELEMELKIPNK